MEYDEQGRRKPASSGGDAGVDDDAWGPGPSVADIDDGFGVLGWDQFGAASDDEDGGSDGDDSTLVRGVWQPGRVRLPCNAAVLELLANCVLQCSPPATLPC